MLKALLLAALCASASCGPVDARGTEAAESAARARRLVQPASNTPSVSASLSRSPSLSSEWRLSRS
jgi:hypothetical protein